MAASAIVAFATSGCGKNNATPESPTTPIVEPPSKTEDFTGNLAPQASDVYQFSVSAKGTVSVTLTEVGTSSPVVIGMSVGLWNISTLTCDDIVKNDAAAAGTTIVGTAEAGTFCSRVYDVGNVVTTQPYKLQVVHP